MAITDENAKILIKALCEYFDEQDRKKPKAVEIFTREEAIRPYGTDWKPGHHIGQPGYEEAHEVWAWEDIFY